MDEAIPSHVEEDIGERGQRAGLRDNVGIPLEHTKKHSTSKHLIKNC